MNWTKLLFAISAVICLPLYGFLSITRFDAQTGFLTAGTLTTVFYAALAVLAVLMLAGSFLQKKQLRFSIFNSRLLAVLAMVLGGVLVLCGVFDLLNIGYAILDSLDFLPAALLSGVLLSGAQAVMAVVSGIVFVRLGVSFLLERITNRSSITFIFPVIWALLACVEMFRDYPQIAGMPERTLYLLCLLCFTLFLMGHSRILGDVDFAKGTCWINAFGFCGALFGLTMTVGEVLCFSSMTLPLSDVLLVFALSLYCLAFSFNTYAER